MPFIFCIYFLRKNTYRDLKVFFVYTALLSTSIVAILTFRYIFKSYNLYILYDRIFLLGEFGLVSYYFSLNVVQEKIRKTIQFLIFPFIIFSLYDYVSSINQNFTFYPIVLECLIFPIIIIIFLYEKMKYISKFPVYLLPGFWIAVAFLIYSTGNFFLFLFSKILLQNLENKILYNNINGFFTILKDILLCTAVVVAKKPNSTHLNQNINFTPIQTTTLPLFTKYT